MTTTVKVAKFRNEADHLFRLANVDYHACVNAREVECWKEIATRVLKEAENLVCARATDYDRQQFTKAVAAVNAQLIAADDRIVQLQRKSAAKTAAQRAEPSGPALLLALLGLPDTSEQDK